MTDNSIAGFGVEEHEVDAVFTALVGDRDGEDIMFYYTHLSSRQALLAAVVRRIADRRAQIAAELYDELEEQRSYAKVAEILQISRPRAQQFIERAREFDKPVSDASAQRST